MDKVNRYKTIAHKIVEGLAAEIHLDKTENLLILDDTRGHYLFFTDGWRGESRQYGCVVHIEVKANGKIWLRRDETDLDIGQQILDENVSKSDIVLAFHSPQIRALMDLLWHSA